jgi:hypothetical protein
LAQLRQLAATQRQLRRLIVAPSGVAAALEEFGAAEARELSMRIQEDSKLSAVERLEVYANAYFYRIRDCLAEDFGALHAGLGAELFHDLVTAYLIAHPPRHPSLRFAGDRLPEFLRAGRAAEPFRRRLPWGGDLARLEWAIVDAFDAADAPTLSRERLSQIAPEHWVSLRFDFQAAYALLSLDWPVHLCRRAWDGGDPPPAAPLSPEKTPICVWRDAEQVRYRTLEALEARGLDLAAGGEPFGALCEQLATEVGDGEAPALAAALLARWQADGLLRDLTA